MTPIEFVVNGLTDLSAWYPGWSPSPASLRLVDYGGTCGDLPLGVQFLAGEERTHPSVALLHWRFHQPAPSVFRPEFSREASTIEDPIGCQDALGRTTFSSKIMIVNRTLRCCA
jgi:hypothetical protein